MNSLDQLKALYYCDLCRRLLLEPVTFLCGNTICKSHVKELLNSENTIDCVFCYGNHFVPENGFSVSKKIQNVLDIELNKLKQSQIFIECKKKIDETTDYAAKTESLAEDPASYIKDIFDLLNKHVNWRRDDLKKKIDKYADETIRLNEYNKFNCIKIYEKNFEIRDLKKSISESRKALDDLKMQLNTFELYDKIESFTIRADDLRHKYGQLFLELRESLILNQDFVFVFDDHPIEKYFGRVIDKNTVKIVEF